MAWNIMELWKTNFPLQPGRGGTSPHPRPDLMWSRTVCNLDLQDGERPTPEKLILEGTGHIAEDKQKHQKSEKLQNESQRFLSTSTLLAKGSMQHRARRASVHPYIPPTFERAFSGQPPETPAPCQV